MKKGRLTYTLFSLTGVILLIKLLGFIKQAVVASTFGATVETDLIQLSEGLVNNLNYLLTQVLTTSFTTVYIHAQVKERAGNFASDALKAFALLAAVLTALLLLAASFCTRILAPGYTPELSARLTLYIRLFAPSIVLSVMSGMFHALLNSNRRFAASELSRLLQSLSVLALVPLLGSLWGTKTLILAFYLYVGVSTLYLGILSRPYLSASQGDPFQNPGVRQILHMAGPLLLGQSMVYINQQVDKALCSGLAEGSVTAMGYAGTLSDLVATLVAALCTVFFTYITARISRGEMEAAENMTVRSASLLSLLLLPISILTILCAEDIVSIAFGRGAFGQESIQATAMALRGYALGFTPLAMRETFARFHYGFEDTRHPMINSCLGIIVNIVLSVTLCPSLGLFGIAFATSVSTVICGILNATTARRHNRTLSFLPFLKLLPWMAMGGIFCVLAAQWSIVRFAARVPIFRFFVVTLFGSGAYLLAVGFPLVQLLRKTA